jgi:citrate lyase subunit beta/citryl-CoA lyase
MTANLPVWRSLLFVPVTVPRFVEGAARRGADAIILDLEDSVAASEKERARTLVPEAAAIVARGGADVVVRINRPWRMAVRDIEAAVGARPVSSRWSRRRRRFFTWPRSRAPIRGCAG